MNFPMQSIIQPFIDATLKTLVSECLLQASTGKAYAKTESDDRKSEAVAMVNIIAKNYSVSLCFCFEEKLLFTLSSRILGQRVGNFSPDIDQAVARWVDSILSHVKLSWPDAQNARRTPLHILKIPNGEFLRFSHESKVPAVIIPFETADGPFRVEMSVTGLKS